MAFLIAGRRWSGSSSGQREVARLLADPASELHFSDDPGEQAAALEDRDYYTSVNVFWVPQVARWETLRNQAKQPEIGRLLDEALVTLRNLARRA